MIKEKYRHKHRKNAEMKNTACPQTRLCVGKTVSRIIWTAKTWYKSGTLSELCL
jgi:hypothetical protein